MRFEYDHLDLLQNIEFSIVQEFRNSSALLDLDVRDAVSALIRYYQAEEEKRSAPALRLAPPAQRVFDSVRHLRILGRPRTRARRCYTGS